jgi:pyridoxine kinase
MPIIAIQSAVAFGHVGNSAGVFPIQRLGVEAWPVDTVQLSNHTGYADWGGGAHSATHVADVLAGVERRGGFAAADALLSGYVGSAELADVIADAVDRMKATNPGALYCCDPVIGNDRAGIFVKAEVARAVAENLVPRADLLTPNRFELAHLTGETLDDVDAVAGAAARLAAAHRPAATHDLAVVVTSVPCTDGIGVLVRDGDQSWLIETPRLDGPANGTGDAFTAMLLARHASGETLVEAAAKAVASVFAILERSDGGELALVAAQDAIVAPGRVFEAIPI